jgi:hypothetical protein
LIRRSAGATFARFVASAAAVLAGLAAVGYFPTRRWGSVAGVDAVAAMLAGCAVSLLAALVGALPLAVASPTPQARAQALLLGMALRFMAVLGAGLAVAVAGEFAAAPLLVWLAISYVALLAVEVGLVVRA